MNVVEDFEPVEAVGPEYGVREFGVSREALHEIRKCTECFFEGFFLGRLSFCVG